MGKLVVLTLEGNLEVQGFRVHLEIGVEGMRPDLEMTKELPANPELATRLEEHWLEKYRPLGAPYRIKPTEIINEGAINLRECHESAKQLEAEFKDWLEAESFREIDRELRSELSREEEIRVLIRTEDRQLQKLPWHLWDFVKSYGKAEVGLSPPEYRRTENCQQITGKLRIRILAILGHQEGIDTQKDRQLLEKLPNAKVTFLVEPSYLEINDRLWEQDWDIIFFAGHSLTEGDEGRIYINPQEFITTDELWVGLRKAVARGLQLAIFNSCDGLGLAQRIGDRQIPLTIVMRELVPDRVAQEFLKYFLTAFASGESFYLAVRSARDRLRALEREFPCASWLPVICQNPATLPPTWEELYPEQKRELVTDFPKRTVRRSLIFSWRYGWSKVLLISLVVTFLVIGVRRTGFLQTWELKTYDQMVRMRPDEGPDPRLLVVEITDKDLFLPEQKGREKNDSSLSDLALNLLLEKLESYQPRVIGLSLTRDFAVDPNLPELKNRLENSDRFYAVCSVKVKGDKPENDLPPPPEVSQEHLGFSNILLDRDGVLRRQIVSMQRQPQAACQADKSFSLQLALRYLENENITVDLDNNQIGNITFPKLSQPPVGAYQNADTWGKQIILNYRSYRSPSEIANKVTLEEILRDKISPNFIKDKIVIIGANHEEANKDYSYATPYSNNPEQKIPVVMIQAQMVSQLINAVLSNRPLLNFLPQWLERFLVFVSAIFGGTIALFFQSKNSFLVTLTVTITILFFGCTSFLIFGFWLPFLPSTIGLVVTASILHFKLKKSK
ncbi:MAG: CHASE2 domain-containing protein [Oscillatoria sp. PMC 1076.18]|nr:CHASE2 domain-containing protein [Oscillatoria sp. PMC 1076.18]